MKFSKKLLILLIFNLAYIIPFTVYYLSIQNFEFLWYVFVLLFFAVLIIATLHRSNFDYIILWGLSIWGLLHMAGGGLILNGEVLYRYVLIPFVLDSADFTILKFDQFVHFFGFAVATLVVYHLLKPYLNEKTNFAVIYPILVSAGMGLGALNEIVEFIAVLVFSETGVGGYFNTSLDLIFNTLGSITAVIFIYLKRKWKNS